MIPEPTRGRDAGISYLRREGAGKALILLHGIGSNAESWLSLIHALPAATDVIAWDAPGYGASDKLPDAAPTPSHYADRLEALLDALHLDRVILVGHSLGTLFTARFAITRSSRVIALALLSPALGYAIAPGAPLPPAVQARIDDLEQLGPSDFAAKRAARLIFRPDAKQAVLESVRHGMAQVRLPGYAQAVRALGAGTLLADAERIAAPTLVAVGAEDVVTPPANALAVYDTLPNKRTFERVPATGHALPQEAPATVVRLLTALMMEETHV
jgi:pimeloyl-ACP methyl ester carboxylesterase